MQHTRFCTDLQLQVLLLQHGLEASILSNECIDTAQVHLRQHIKHDTG